ncbi:MAG: TIM barrel protein [Pirellulales bacterium]|nr:TIM barrel protein [Pirellulales bacterium]
MSSLRRSAGAISRRGFVAGAAAACAGAAIAPGNIQAAEKPAVPPKDYRIQNGRIRQSVMGWCFDPMPTEELIEACHRMGMPAMEGIDKKHYPRLRELGMTPGIVGSHGFQKGPFHRDNHAFCIEKLREGIRTAAEFGSPNVICFTGYREGKISDEAGMQSCVDCWKQVIGLAEEKGVNLCLEHLNTRDATHPMKGHPGYFGDDMDLCIDLVKRVDSPRMKVLFDVYHVQIMNGDVIRRIRQYKDYIGHMHAAGVPGRGELDDTQELNYPAIMRAVVEAGYTGFVAQEFIPTWPDKLAALRHAVRLCDV